MEEHAQKVGACLSRGTVQGIHLALWIISGSVDYLEDFGPCTMSDEETREEPPPFSPDQLMWLDRLIEARGATRHTAGMEPTTGDAATSPLPVSSTPHTSGEWRVGLPGLYWEGRDPP